MIIEIHGHIRKIVLCLLYFSIPLFLYCSLYKSRFIRQFDTLIFITTIICLIIIINRNFIMNGFHGCVLFMCCFLYGFLTEIQLDKNTSVIDVLKLFVTTIDSVDSLVAGEIRERVVGSIMWMAALYLPSLGLYYMAYFGISDIKLSSN